MHRSIAQGPAPDGRVRSRPAAPGTRSTLLVGGGLVLVMLALYLLTRPAWQVLYTHFLWQAQAWLEGQSAIRWPVYPTATSPGSAHFHDVVAILGPDGAPTGRALIPFPPFPALVLLPLVALFGLATDQGFVSVVLGALDVGVAFWLLGRLPVRPPIRIALTVFLGAGTALWYAASLGSTWYFAHVVSLAPALLAVGLALDAEAADRGRRPGSPRRLLDGRQVAAGLLLGIAATSRLTMAVGLPFLLFVGGGGGWLRRGVSAILGASIPVLALVVYTLVTTGQPFNPAYEVLYRSEVVAYPDLHYNAAWSLQDVRYIPQNLGIMLAGFPVIMPACEPGTARSIWSATGCGVLVPRQVGTSLLLTSPAWLLALPALRAIRRDRVVAGAALATLGIATVNLMHFSQGWVQFGYRFSLDFAPFLLVLAALGTERLVAAPGRAGRRGAILAAVLVAASVAVQAWGLAWARTLGW